MSRARAKVAPFVVEWEGEIERGWTSLIPLRAGIGRFPALYLAYYAGDGRAQVGTFRMDRKRPLAPLFDLVMSQREWGRFATCLVGGVPHVLGYAMNHGNVGVDRILLDERRSEPVWKSSWSASWTTLEGFELDGRTYVLSYRPADGVATIDRFSRDGKRPEPIWETGDDSWPTGFTTIHPISVGGHPHLLFYRNRDGFAALAHVRRGGRGVAQLWDNFEARWERGWHGFAAFSAFGLTWVLRHRLTDGALELDRVAPDASSVETVWSGQRRLGTTLLRLDDRGSQFVAGYERATGSITLCRLVDGRE